MRAEDDVDGSGDERRAEADLERLQVRRSVAIAQKSAQPSAAERQTSPDKRDEDDQREVGKREAERQSETRNDARLPEAPPRLGGCCGHVVLIFSLLGRLVDLVEYAAVAEMIRLRLRPAAEDRIVDGDQLDFRQFLRVWSAGTSSGFDGR